MRTTAQHEARHAARLERCVQTGRIASFDKGFIDFSLMWDLTERGIYFVTRSKDKMRFRVVKKRLRKPVINIPRDDEILLLLISMRATYSQRMRLVTSLLLNLLLRFLPLRSRCPNSFNHLFNLLRALLWDSRRTCQVKPGCWREFFNFPENV